MLNEEEIIKYLKKKLKPARFTHSIGVMEKAIELANIYSVDLYNEKLI